MVFIYLLLIVAGIGLTQWVSDPRQVTLLWLRLGGIISICLLALGTGAAYWAGTPIHGPFWLVAAFVTVCAQLMLVQMGHRTAQRLAAGLAWICATGVCTAQMELSAVGFISLALSGGMLGSFLMSMFLGHAYLTAGSQMDQAPFLRLTKLCAVVLVLRCVASLAFGLWPALKAAEDSFGSSLSQMWDQVMMASRYFVGLLVPAVFVYMVHDCVKRSANQSATGILYVAGVLVMMGEGIALALLRATGFVF